MKNLLVTSIPSWNQSSGSDTFSSLMKGIDPSGVANLYVRGAMPDSSAASRYFHIDEISVIKSCLNPSIKTGEEVCVSVPDSKAGAPAEVSIYHHRSKLILWLRELGWKFGRWNSKELDSFLESVNPDVLLFPIESYPYFNRINEYIIEKCEPQKVVGYLWDDNFTYKQHPHSLVFKIERFFLRKQVRRLINSCIDVLAISPKMKEECDKEFGVDSIVITKPIFNCGEFEDYQAGTPVRILYTGKLIIGRDDTVIEVVKAIKEVNKEGQKAILDIYTNTQLSEDKKAKIAVEGCCNLHDPVPQSEVAALQKKADVLLFAESLSDRDLTARLSFSTKLTDYFAAGKCIWAVGNSDLGPIEYLRKEDAGLISTSLTGITEKLNLLINNSAIISEYAEKAYRCGENKHNKDMITNKLYCILTSTGGGNSLYINVLYMQFER